MEKEVKFDGTLPKDWKYFGCGKFKDKRRTFWMCGCCQKIFYTERGYNYHMSAVRCKESPIKKLKQQEKS